MLECKRGVPHFRFARAHLTQDFKTRAQLAVVDLQAGGEFARHLVEPRTLTSGCHCKLCSWNVVQVCSGYLPFLFLIIPNIPHTHTIPHTSWSVKQSPASGCQLSTASKDVFLPENSWKHESSPLCYRALLWPLGGSEALRKSLGVEIPHVTHSCLFLFCVSQARSAWQKICEVSRMSFNRLLWLHLQWFPMILHSHG